MTVSLTAPAPLLAVLGSVTRPGRLRAVVTGALERVDGPTGLLDLADVQLPFADGRPPAEAGGDTVAVLARIEAAEALLLATPIYRGSLTGSLKNLLDLVPLAALEGKPVALLVMGTTQHHFLGADRHLRDMLAFFGAHVTPVGGYLTAKDFVDGVPTEAAAATVDRLLAGAMALRDAAAATAAHGLRPLVAGH